MTSAGGVMCWGDNDYGQLGDGTTADRMTPVIVSGLTSGVVALSAGGSHTCALTTGAGMKCWGRNGEGQLGDVTTADRPTPVDVFGLTSGVVAVAAGTIHTCAVTSAGGVKCWGFNPEGQLGDGTKRNRMTPVDVSGLTSGVVALSAGTSHTCVLTGAGGVKCWGRNADGNLGDGTADGYGRTTPVDVSGLTSGAIAVTTQYDHTCALTSAGDVKCWGDNWKGALGDGTIGTDRSSPVWVVGFGGTVAISLVGDLTFGNVPVNTTAARAFTINNIGNSPLTVSGISYPPGFFATWSGTIAAGGSRTVTVLFAPSAPTTYAGIVTANANQTSGTNTLEASGTGMPQSRLIGLSGDLAFGNVPVNATETRTLTISNTGNSSLTVSGVSCPTGFSGAWSGAIAAGGSQPVTVTFAPTAETSYGGTVIVDADQTSGTNSMPASGVGVALTFTDSPLQPGNTIKAVHVVELRQRIDQIRSRYGLSTFGWTDAALTGIARAIHIAEMRTALAEAYVLAARPLPTYMEPQLTARGTLIKAAHITELRAAVVALW
jgi:hypothetical protein